MCAFIITILFLYRKLQLGHENDLKQIKSKYEENLLRTQLEIQEHTIQNISREIHDNITLTLTLAKLQLNTIETNDTKLNEQIKSSIELIGQAINDLSSISRGLNSDIIIEQGLISALKIEIDKLNRLEQFLIQIEVSGIPVFLDSQRELFVFRIIQEAFNNILKHAKAKNVWLNLFYSTNEITISVKDDGVGFNGNIGTNCTVPTAGLLNMKKRAELLNGLFEIKTATGYGTQINLSIPISQ